MSQRGGHQWPEVNSSGGLVDAVASVTKTKVPPAKNTISTDYLHCIGGCLEIFYIAVHAGRVMQRCELRSPETMEIITKTNHDRHMTGT